MSNLVRCQGCKTYRDRGGMNHVGLGFVCDNGCLELIKARARVKHVRRQQVRTRTTAPNGDQRKRVRKRDGDRCRWCGGTNMLAVHHIEYLSQGGANAVINLITLCRVHHEQVHSNKGVWQPILRATIWMTYSGKLLTVPEVQAYLLRIECQ